MSPMITNLLEEDGILRFTLSDVDMSLANALRRTILSDIPCVVFRTVPHAESKVTIETNTTRLNNEIVKQRLAAVPIHLGTDDQPVHEYALHIDVTNDTEAVTYVTTENFTVHNTQTGKPLSQDAVRQMFPPDPTTGTFIDLVRLRPRVAAGETGESLKLSCGFDVGTAGENGSYNVVSTCAYGFTVDAASSAADLSKALAAMKKSGAPREEITIFQANWPRLEGKRRHLKDSFNFTVKSIGQYTNMQVISLGCAVITRRLRALASVVEASEDVVAPAETTMPRCYDVTLHNEDYTLGKLIEYILYIRHYQGTKRLTYCGFRKPHPHIPQSFIRLAFESEEATPQSVRSLVISACDEAAHAVEALAAAFPSSS